MATKLLENNLSTMHTSSVSAGSRKKVSMSTGTVCTQACVPMHTRTHTHTSVDCKAEHCCLQDGCLVTDLGRGKGPRAQQSVEVSSGGRQTRVNSLLMSHRHATLQAPCVEATSVLLSHDPIHFFPGNQLSQSCPFAPWMLLAHPLVCVSTWTGAPFSCLQPCPWPLQQYLTRDQSQILSE